MSELSLQDKVVVISGGTKGVGKAVAESLAGRGAKIVVGGRDAESAEGVVRRIADRGGEALFVPTELTSADDCAALFDRAFERFGRLDGFFNYAGITSVSPLDECSPETFDSITSVNFRAAFFCCQRAIRYMRRSGGGSIVLTGSPHAWSGEKDRAAYACSKGALLTLTEHIAHNYAAEQIRCNYLVLGWTATEGELALRRALGESEADLRRRAGAFTPMGRMCESTDYLETLAYLLSDASRILTGSVLQATGGAFI